MEVIADVPSPRNRRARSMVSCRPSPARILIGGAPSSPCRRDHVRGAQSSACVAPDPRRRLLRGRFARAKTAEEREEAALDLQLGRVGWRRADPSFRQVFASQLLPDATQEIWDAFNELQRATTSIDNVVRFLDVFAHINVTDIVELVRCPTLIFHSRGDLRRGHRRKSWPLASPAVSSFCWTAATTC
ncbi:MAG: hypothetical protein ACRD29_08830 [Acidimicrobiales bacterium]